MSQQQAPTPSFTTFIGSLLGGGRKKLEVDNLLDWKVIAKTLPKDVTQEEFNKLVKVVGAPNMYPNDYRKKKGYRYSRQFENWLRNGEEGITGKIFSHPVSGALVAGAGGYGAGKLGEMLDEAITGKEEPMLPWGTIGMLLSAVGGGVIGEVRKNVKEYNEKKNAGGMEKQNSVTKSAMYTDPRNFILERLQGASDISPFEKAQLAARVRSMSTSGAEILKSLVRSAMGFGVGAIIARFFGMSVMGMGGMGALAGALIPSGNSRPMGIF